MNLPLDGDKLTFHQKRGRNPARYLILIILILASFFILRAVNRGEVKSPFMPTPTPTRTSNSFAYEGSSHFSAGNLAASIRAYQNAVKQDPGNARLWSELARIQTYSSALLTTDGERRVRLREALDSINRAVKLAADDSTVQAIRVLVLDWNSNPAISGDQSAALLTDAEQTAVLALQLDNQNTLALAYYAEVLVDQQKWLQADQYIRQAVQRDPSLMDVHRVNAYVQESIRNYSEAITEYKRAVEITPNLTFLYISIGRIYRHLASTTTVAGSQYYETALDYFTKAARINEQLEIKDPIPYLAIGNTYIQMGEFFAAARNVRKALEFNPTNPEVYATLGMVYFKSRNYEGAIPAFKCAVRGCNAPESCDVRDCDIQKDPAIEIQGLPLSLNTVVYYYTYGSVLAGMHQPGNNLCQEALPVLKEVRQEFAKDDSIMQIVQSSESVCASFGFKP